MRQHRSIHATPRGAAPSHPAVRPARAVHSGAELDALLVRARTLRARALRAIWLRFRRHCRHGLAGWLRGPATQHQPFVPGRRCRAS